MDFKLPEKIEKLTVMSSQQELGLLSHGSIHYFQPTQIRQHISLTMTRNSLDGYSSGSLHPIFAQNLPEGYNRRYIAERLARYARVNDMYLLALQGAEGIGMLSYDGGFELPQMDTIPLNDILTYTHSTPLFPQLLEKYYLRNALSGVQPKVSLPSTDRTVQQKELIVKSFDEEFPLLTVNEYVCMQAAKHCGLEPPKTYLSENLETFVIERFDKPQADIFNGSELGYEDFTTLLKKSNNPDSKYNGSYETLLKAAMLYTNSLDEVIKIYKYVVFNCLIGNGDAHLKNFALQYTSDMKNIFISPPFDITHTLIYPTINNKMALKMAGSKEFPTKEHLIKLGTSPYFKIRNAKQIVEEMAQGILASLALSQEVVLFDGLRQSIEKSIANTMKNSTSKTTYRHDKKRKFE